jgi:HTH-type transcriptional regulator/antitoxin HigA
MLGDHDWLDNFWFTLLHECAHVIKHVQTPGEAFVDDTEMSIDSDGKEIEANRLARDMLIQQKYMAAKRREPAEDSRCRS